MGSKERNPPTPSAGKTGPPPTLPPNPMMSRPIEERIDLEDTHALGPTCAPCDFVSCFDFPFVQHTEIEAGPSVFHQQRGHIRLVHADAHPVTGDTRLRHFEQ